MISINLCLRVRSIRGSYIKAKWSAIMILGLSFTGSSARLTLKSRISWLSDAYGGLRLRTHLADALEFRLFVIPQPIKAPCFLITLKHNPSLEQPDSFFVPLCQNLDAFALAPMPNTSAYLGSAGATRKSEIIVKRAGGVKRSF